MPTVPEGRTVADALEQALTNAGLRASMTVAPDDRTPPYVVLHPDPGGLLNNPFAPNKTLRVSFQLTAVGATPGQALWAHDKAREAILTAQLDVPGRKLHRPNSMAAQPVRRDESVEPAVFIATAQYAVTSSPA